MPSPFTGMDPWLESRALFPSVHNTYIAGLLEAINAIIPPPYFAAIGTRIVIEGGDPDRYVEPDVDILKPVGLNGSHGPAGGGGVATAQAIEVAPVMVHIPRDEITEWLIEVRTGDGDDRLVTSIEVLSRSNKRAGGEGRAEYLRKQKEMRERRVNLVEIDLLRSGTHTTAVPLAAALRKTGPFDYYVCVYRPDRPEDLEVYPIRLPQKLPSVAIPLAPGSPDISVNLQSVFDRCYDVGIYSRRVKYTTTCEPPLTPEQQAWAGDILREKRLLK